MNIAGVEAGGNNPCRFVAEISNNHNGSLDRALRLIDAAKAAGADFIKTQCYTPDELVALRGDGPAPEPWGSQGWTMRRLYEKAQTPHAWFPALVTHCERVGIPWFSSVFGAESLALLESLNCPAYKVARLDNKSRALRGMVVSTRKPVLVSQAHEHLRHDRAGEARLFCPPGYPPDSKGLMVPNFASRTWLGMSSHCLDPLLPVAAVARGCKLIEMHMMLEEEPSALEANVSLNQYQFGQMIQAARRVEAMLA